MAVLTVSQILTGEDLGVSSGTGDVLVAEVGGEDVLYVLNQAENTLIEVEVAPDGTLSVVDSIVFEGTIPAGTEPHLDQGSTASGDEFLSVSGLTEADGQTISLSSTGDLGEQESLTGTGALEQSISVEVDGVPVVVDADSSGGLDHYSDPGSGYTEGTGLSDTADRYLADVAAIVSFEHEGTTYVATVSSTEHGVNIASVSSDGLTQVDALGVNEGLPVGSPSDIEVIQRLGETLLIVPSQTTSSLSVMAFDDDELIVTDHIYDNDTTQFQGASEVTTETYGDFAYAATGGAEGGVSLFTILPGGRLVHLDSIADDETVPLDQISSLDSYVAGDTLHIVTGSSNEAGVVNLTYDLSETGEIVMAPSDGSGATGTSLDDQIIGSDASETLVGGAGDDIILDGDGSDVLTGGAGADLFILVPDGETDYITDFEVGVDRLDLSDYDFLYDISQVSIIPTSDGATLTFGGETLIITTSDQTPLTADDLSNDDILNVDRPPDPTIGLEFVGTTADDTLVGGSGDDTISGLGGEDSIPGGDGQDVLSGGLDNDTLEGEDGADTLIGNAGDDLLFGGAGDDVIYGDDWF
ncbi:MAG: hypothetical protein AAFR73_07775 [Pseudomonadota bacterium]